MASLVLVPAFLLFIYWVMLRTPKFSRRRASVSVRSLTGHNVAMYFAVFGAAELIMALAGDLSAGKLTSPHPPGSCSPSCWRRSSSRLS